jgi:hypothetical protein
MYGAVAQPVDAGVGQEVDEDDPSAEALRCQRLRIEPAGRTLERWDVALDRKDVRIAGEAVGDRPEETGAAGRCCRRRAAGAVDMVSLSQHRSGLPIVP